MINHLPKEFVILLSLRCNPESVVFNGRPTKGFILLHHLKKVLSFSSDNS